MRNSFYFLLVLPAFLFFTRPLPAQSFTARQCFYEGRTYVVTEQFWYPGKFAYFGVDMEAAAEIPDTALARKLYKGIIGSTDPRSVLPNSRKTTSKQRYQLVTVRDKNPGSLYYRDIRSFDRILDQDEKTLSKKKRNDKKNYKYNGVYDPSELITFHEASLRYYLFGRFGIYSIHQDSLQGEATTVMEYTGFWFRSAVSNSLFNPDVLVMQFEISPGRNIYKQFDMRSNMFTNIPQLNEIDPKLCISSLSSPYLAFTGLSTNNKDVHSRTILYNYETGQTLCNLRYSFPTDKYRYDLFLHKSNLFIKYVEPSRVQYDIKPGLFGSDLLKGPKSIYQHYIKE